jgi:cytochrome P450
MLRTAEQIEKALQELIAKKKANAPEFPDMLSLLIAARDGDGGALTEAEMIGESYTVLCQDTTATALSWTIFLLAQHPPLMERLLGEIEIAVGNGFPTVTQMMNMPFLDQVIKESMRILPPSGFGFRYTASACNLGAYSLPKDATVFFSQYVLHRNPQIFAEPDRFLPDRWATLKPAACEFIPFGTGVHSCLGVHFALAEMKIILTMMLQRFMLQVVPGTRIDRAYTSTMFPKYGLPMLVHEKGSRPLRNTIRGNVLQMINFY